MQINSLTNCSKPRFFKTFTGNENSAKPRYKHYEQMSDEVLGMRSIIKAHHEVEQSGKMKLFKAMPGIATALIGTSIAMTQPGKFSAKAATGLGFLAISQGTSAIVNTVDQLVDKKANKENKKTNSTKQKVIGILAATTASTIATVGVIASVKNAKKLEPIKKFLSKEANQMANELNATKVGKFVNEKFNPFIEKHALAKATTFLAPAITLAAGIGTQLGLAKSLSKDLKEKANENYVKGKFIQEIARKDFESINATEV